MQLNEITQATNEMTTEQFVSFILERFGRHIALASSFGAEDQVLTDMLCRLTPAPRIFTLDTGRLPQETYDTIEATRNKYGLSIHMLFPDRHDLETMMAESGPNLFYADVDARKHCCDVRKVRPLRRALSGLQAWMTGLRREQSPTRSQLQRVEWDDVNRLLKFNPLADWTTRQVWDYISARHVPFNKLHNLGYQSIGCAPCTRATEPCQDIRAGRWWWEEPQHKECGLHRRPETPSHAKTREAVHDSP